MHASFHGRVHDERRGGVLGGQSHPREKACRVVAAAADTAAIVIIITTIIIMLSAQKQQTNTYNMHAAVSTWMASSHTYIHTYPSCRFVYMRRLLLLYLYTPGVVYTDTV